MRIAIDLNDVVRDFSNNYLKYYIEGYNHEFSLDDFSFWTNDKEALFPFKSEEAYRDFTYNDYAFELFGKCDVCERNLGTKIKQWIDKDIPDMENEKDIEFMFVSPYEYGNSVGYTYFFISKLGVDVREVYMPKNILDIWNKCDILITANPDLLNNKPKDKISIKIKTEYNTDIEADETGNNLSNIIENKKVEKFF